MLGRQSQQVSNPTPDLDTSQDYDLASHVALSAQAKHADQRALALGLLDYITVLISHMRSSLFSLFSSSGPSPHFTDEETDARESWQLS